MREKLIIIADVLYTTTDETYYLLDQYSHQSEFQAETLEEVREKLQAAGWSPSGLIGRYDNVIVEMWWHSKNDYIAIWDERIQPYIAQKE